VQTIALILLLSVSAEPEDRKPPSPPSPVIAGIEWAPAESIVRAARDGDNWPLTWADDDALYTTWGDGTGFVPKVEKKLSCGFARVTGGPGDFKGVNIRSPAEQFGGGRAGKKGWGMLCVEGTLYLWFGHADNQGGQAQLAWSRDHAQTWTFADWKFAELGLLGFVNFGRNYAGARDEFVYAYSHDGPRADTPADRFVLLRAPKDRLTQREAWEFFMRVDDAGEPVWTRDFLQRGAVFQHAEACLRSAITYCAPLKRYLWWQHLPQPPGVTNDRGDTRFKGGFGVYDAPQPWGPWTTAFFTTEWDVGPGEHADFPAKWMSEDGKTLHLVFSGEDSFSVRQARLKLHDTRMAAVEIIAHRGASYDAPENTLAAFRLGWQQHADANELDVHLTRDGQIVALHDSSTERTTGVQREVVEQTLAELRGQDAGTWKAPQWAGEKIPTLAESLATIPDGKRMFIEIKCGSEILPELKRVLAASGKTREQLVIIGFDYQTMADAKQRFPHLEVYWVVGHKDSPETGKPPELDDLAEKAAAAGLDGLDLNYRFPLDGEAVARLRARGLKVFVWTVDDAAVAARLASAGVDGITTNRPQWLREQLKRTSSGEPKRRQRPSGAGQKPR
jgi:glycerophosphoryl diester phosphodiesterase